MPPIRPLYIVLAHRRLIATARAFARSGLRARAARNLALAARARHLLAELKQSEATQRDIFAASWPGAI